MGARAGLGSLGGWPAWGGVGRLVYGGPDVGGGGGYLLGVRG